MYLEANIIFGYLYIVLIFAIFLKIRFKMYLENVSFQRQYFCYRDLKGSVM